MMSVLARDGGRELGDEPGLGAARDLFITGGADIVPPQTLLRGQRKLIAKKYDSSGDRKPGRPRKAGEIRELVEHYPTERNLQGLGNKILKADFDVAEMKGVAACSKRLGGMLRYYHRRVA